MQLVMDLPPVFGYRKDPKVLPTSDGSMFLIGGNQCADGPEEWKYLTLGQPFCWNNKAFNDVWKSTDGGVSWICYSMHIDLGLWTPTSRGIGPYFTAVIAPDDTMYIMAGVRSNMTEGLDLIFTSESPELDLWFSGTPFLQDLIIPGGDPTSLTGPPYVTIVFRESMQWSTGLAGPIRVIDLSNKSWSLPIEKSIDGQTLTIKPIPPLAPGHEYNVEVPHYSLGDLVGNSMAWDMDPVFEFVFGDGTPPTLIGMEPDMEEGVEPWTSILLTFSEAVEPGRGSLILTSPVGETVSLNILSAAFVNSSVTDRQTETETGTQAET